MRRRSSAIFAIVLWVPTLGAVPGLHPETRVAQIPPGAHLRVREQQPELRPGTDIARVPSPKIGEPINCTGASEATKAECYAATQQVHRSIVTSVVPLIVR
jgi:hypothetical protein